MQSTDSLRASGILLHPTSLPGPYGIGDLGPEAYRFVNFLEETGQTLWQILPVNPPGFENSPYMCFSAFAMNPLLISPDGLVTEGLLEPGDTRNLPQFNPECVDYGSVINFKMPLLEKSFALFQKRLIDVGVEDYHDFCRRNASWLEDFALFMALKRANGGTVWTKWEKDLAERTSQKLVEWRNKMDEEIHFHKYLQYLVFKQWDSLKNYCHNKGVRIIGDLPIYVAHDSADVWVNRKLFSLDEKGDPLVVAGVPPDYYSRTGQYWGNPIYNWEEMAKSGYGWWIDRMRLNYSLFDIIRLDHFRGFESYWEIPAKETAAITGRWKKGPGASLFNAIRNALGDIHVIAEDLGFITPEVDALRDHLGFPGMKILQRAFSDSPKAPEYRPHNYTSNCAVYSATHDHNTTVAWFTAEPGTQTTQTKDEVEQERRCALQYLGTGGEEIQWDFIRLALSSIASIAIFPLQDVLGLGVDARMNIPGTIGGNWRWRFSINMLTPEIKDRLAALTGKYERKPVIPSGK